MGGTEMDEPIGTMMGPIFETAGNNFENSGCDGSLCVMPAAGRAAICLP
jgi:hypothetical protein